MIEVQKPQREALWELHEELYLPIPTNAGDVTDWKELPISKSDEGLVPLGPFSREAWCILTSSVYFGETNSSPYICETNKLSGALLSLFAREKVAERLLIAEELLPPGLHLLVFDAYRPLEVQSSLYDFYRGQLAFQRPDMSEDALESETQKYVSLPSYDQTRPSPHNTGGSIDLGIITLPPEQEAALSQIHNALRGDALTIEDRVSLEMQKSALIRHYGKMLNFGTAFDHGSERAALAYFENLIAQGETLTSEEMEACLNRRLLYNIMIDAGMMPYFAEWWHFNAPESQMGAKTMGLDQATYGAADLVESNWLHEVFRREVYDEAVCIQEKRMTLGTVVVDAASTALQNMINKTLEQTGETRIGGNWPTELIAPQPLQIRQNEAA